MTLVGLAKSLGCELRMVAYSNVHTAAAPSSSAMHSTQGYSEPRTMPVEPATLSGSSRSALRTRTPTLLSYVPRSRPAR